MKKLFLALAAAALLSSITAGCSGPVRLTPTLTEAQAAHTVQRQALAPNLYELVYSPSQQAVFVAAPDLTQEDSQRGPSRLLRLDAQTLQVQAEIELPHRGFGLALDESKGRIYVGHGFDGAISAVDIQTNRVVGTLQLLERIADTEARRPYTHSLRQLVVDPAAQRLYLAALGNGGQRNSQLMVVDTASFTLERIVPGLGYESTGMALDVAGGRLFVSNLQAQLITLDTHRLGISQTAEIEVDQPINIAYDASQNRIFATDQGIGFRAPWRNKALGQDMPARSAGHQVVVLDAATGAALGQWKTDANPLAVLHDAQRQRLYVTNFNGIRVNEGRGSLSIYDSSDGRLLHVLALPPHPNSLALDAARNVLYVSVKNDQNSKQQARLESVVRIELDKL